MDFSQMPPEDISRTCESFAKDRKSENDEVLGVEPRPFKILTYLAGLLVLFLWLAGSCPRDNTQSKSSAKPTPAATQTITDNCSTRAGGLGALTPQDLDMAIDILRKDDHAAFAKLIQQRRLYFLPADKRVTIETREIFGGHVKIRLEGEVGYIWTSKDDIICR